MKKLAKRLYAKNRAAKAIIDFVFPIVEQEPKRVADIFADPKRVHVIAKARHWTMGSYRRLSNLYHLGKVINKENIPGAVVECGTWRGGSSAVMFAGADNNVRHLWAFDSFEGLPEPKAIDGDFAKVFAGGKADGKLEAIGQCVAAEDELREVWYKKFHFPKDRTHIVKGWFQDTVKKTAPQIGPIALLHLDGDFYESIKECLLAFYDQISPGGYIVLDDYGCWVGCKIAVHEFLDARGIRAEIVRVDSTGAYFQKPYPGN